MIIYDYSELSNLRDANINIMSFSVIDNNPLLQFQNSTSNYLPYKFAIRNIDGMPMYLYEKSLNNYIFISFADVIGTIWYHIHPEFDEWLSENCSTVLNCQIILFNGIYNYVFITKKKNYKYNTNAYSLLWQENNEFWNVPPNTNIYNYISSLSGYDIRLFTEYPSFYTKQIKDDIIQYIKYDKIPYDIPVLGKLYVSSDFSQISQTDQQFIILTVENNYPKFIIQNGNGKVKYVKFVRNDIDGYVIDIENNKYEYLTHVDRSVYCYIIIDILFASWLSNNYCYNISGLDLQINSKNISNIFIVTKPLLTPKHTVIYVNDYSKFWQKPHTNINIWLSHIVDYDVRLFENNEFDDDIINNIVKYTEKIITMNDREIDENINCENITNLIYTKSLYENSVTHYNGIINKLQQEYDNEIKLKNMLDSHGPELLTKLQLFVDTKQNEITNKLNDLQILSSNYKYITGENLNNIVLNKKLYDYLISQKAIKVSNDILQLNNTVKNCEKLLSKNKHDTIYVVNKKNI